MGSPTRVRCCVAFRLLSLLAKHCDSLAVSNIDRRFPCRYRILGALAVDLRNCAGNQAEVKRGEICGKREVRVAVFGLSEQKLAESNALAKRKCA
jgi:hypothetical protein